MPFPFLAPARSDRAHRHVDRNCHAAFICHRAFAWRAACAARVAAGRSASRKMLPCSADPSSARRLTRPWLRRLKDADAVPAVIAPHGAELVLSGHDHIAARDEIPGPTAPCQSCRSRPRPRRSAISTAMPATTSTVSTAHPAPGPARWKCVEFRRTEASLTRQDPTDAATRRYCIRTASMKIAPSAIPASSTIHGSRLMRAIARRKAGHDKAALDGRSAAIPASRYSRATSRRAT